MSADKSGSDDNDRISSSRQTAASLYCIGIVRATTQANQTLDCWHDMKHVQDPQQHACAHILRGVFVVWHTECDITRYAICPYAKHCAHMYCHMATAM
ncbi:hypothetical protein ABBQ32_004892 [Trebouxia sp. C0010 RCD-2024]